MIRDGSFMESEMRDGVKVSPEFMVRRSRLMRSPAGMPVSSTLLRRLRRGMQHPVQILLGDHPQGNKVFPQSPAELLLAL